ncbi:hypothetical protein KM043_009910 [Ampulex compressa]|nr:hypothetical protein KM043_009910 [Ampulex compressa]
MPEEPEGIRRTSGFGDSAAYIGARNERASKVSLVLVTFLSTGTACHVNLLLATHHRAVSLSAPRLLALAADHGGPGRMDGRTAGQGLDASKKNITGTRDAAKLPH